MKKKRPAVSVTHVEDGRRTPVPPPKRGKKGTGNRVLVFFITLLLCLVLFGLLGFFLLRDQLLAPDGATSAPVTTSQGTSAPAPYNLLVIGSADKDAGDCFWLIRFQGSPASLTVTALPAETMIESDGRRDRLSGYLSYGGVSAASQAAGTLCGISVDRTLRLTAEQLEGVVDKYGGLIYTVPQRLEQYDAGGNLTVSLSAGRQSLTGAQVRQLLLYTGWDDGRSRQIAVQQEAMAAFLNQSLSSYNLGQAETNFLYLVNHSETTLSRADFDTWLPWFQKMSGTSPAGAKKAEGDYAEADGQPIFTMTDSQRAALGKAFGAKS